MAEIGKVHNDILERTALPHETGPFSKFKTMKLDWPMSGPFINTGSKVFLE